MGFLFIKGAALIDVPVMTCADSRGPNLELLRESEESNLLGGGRMPLPAKWDTDARARIEKLRSAHGDCPLLSRADESGSSRRRRYFSDGMKLGDGFLGGGGW